MRALLCLTLFTVFAQQPPPPRAELSPDQKAAIAQKTTQLGALAAALKAKHADPSLLADVEIFHKAGLWMQEFPEEFFTPEDIPKAISVLDQGLTRAKDLNEGRSPWMSLTGRRVHGFYSALDGSVQLYGLRIPENYDPAKPARLYVFLHGREPRLTEASFIDRFQKPTVSHTTAAEEGQLQLDIYGRWNGIAFHWVGEADILEAIRDVQRRYKIDDKRILLRGFSMGGCGAWHIAMHHPGMFAAAEIGAGTWPRRTELPDIPPYQFGPLHIYENINDWSLNFFNLPLAAHDGDSEKGVSSIPPPPPGTVTRGQLESSIHVREQLAREGFASEGDPYDLRAKGTEATFYISKDTGHSTSKEVRVKLDAFLKQYGDRGIVSPNHIRFLTYTTRYNRSHWVTVEGLARHYERGEVDAERSADGKKYTVKTRNLTRLRLAETSRMTQLELDGQNLAVKAAAEVVFENAGNVWKPAGKLAGLHKIHGLQGPIDDAFIDPFLLVRPTGQPWNEAAHQQVRRMIARFDRLYAKHLRAHPRVKDDKDVTAADVQNYNLILLGDPGSNRWIARVQAKLPLQWTKQSVTLGGQTYSAAEHFPALVYPNPLNPSRYVVLNTGLTFDAREFGGEYAMPRFGDFAMLKVKPGDEVPDIAAAGLFDEAWRVSNDWKP